MVETINPTILQIVTEEIEEILNSCSHYLYASVYYTPEVQQNLTNYVLQQVPFYTYTEDTEVLMREKIKMALHKGVQNLVKTLFY